MSIRVLTSLDELRRQLGSSAEHPAVANYFCSWDWFAVLQRHGLDPRHQPRLYVRYEGDQPNAVLYCCTLRRGELLSLSSFYTNQYDAALFGAAQETAALAEFAQYLAAERPRWHSIQFRYLNAERTFFKAMQQQLRRHGFFVYDFFQYENWYAPVAGLSFAKYWDARNSRLRNTVTRRGKKAAKEGSVTISLVTERGDALEAAIRDYQRVYSSSWKNAEPYPEFMPNLIRACADRGVLRLGQLHFNGEPAASQIWIVSNGTAMIYKLAYDERFKDYSVGSLVSLKLFERVLDVDYVTELDYGVGSEPYKRDWMTAVREIRGVEALNLRTLRGIAAALSELLKRPLRRARDLRRNSKQTAPRPPEAAADGS
ncbi:MAG TPA: GNAT family N-acetyltransferase [Steroidobacteraceae bacterium]|jgi:hypothetical protein|nr:GNAT family N-acetyltransferase [Steroidobacteraceae bacterium]